MKNLNINIIFPNHHFVGQITLNNESFENGLIIAFPAINERPDEEKILMAIITDCYEKNDLISDDKFGEIWLDKWHFNSVWPISVNFGFLEHTSDITFSPEVTWKYKKIDIRGP